MVWIWRKLRDFLTVSKKSEIDQKIAMMYGYAEDVRIIGKMILKRI